MPSRPFPEALREGHRPRVDRFAAQPALEFLRQLSRTRWPPRGILFEAAQTQRLKVGIKTADHRGWTHGVTLRSQPDGAVSGFAFKGPTTG